MIMRKYIPKDKLANWMTSKLQNFEGCENCIVQEPYSLKEPDEEGCNWSISLVKATDVPREILEPALRDVVLEARSKYNVE